MTSAATAIKKKSSVYLEQPSPSQQNRSEVNSHAKDVFANYCWTLMRRR